MTLTTRPTHPADAAAMCAVLNPIIRAGGTTAIEEELDAQTLRHWFIDGPHVLVTHVVLQGARLVGFQSVSDYGPMPEGWGDIGTFTDRANPVPGAGTALFAATCGAAGARGLQVLNATIRADNHGGLRFYRGLGFMPYKTTPSVPLADGRPVDRISHRLDLPVMPE
jgi:L-amino acid N-acyltransferase YncA